MRVETTLAQNTLRFWKLSLYYHQGIETPGVRRFTVQMCLGMLGEVANDTHPSKKLHAAVVTLQNELIRPKDLNEDQVMAEAFGA